jgi:hypothetical protein
MAEYESRRLKRDSTTAAAVSTAAAAAEPTSEGE